jgi:hypothetical protein
MVQCNTDLAESSKEGYGSKKAVLPMMMTMMINLMQILLYTELKLNFISGKLLIKFRKKYII